MPGTGPGNVSTLDDKTRTAMRPTPVALLGPGEQPRLSGYPSRQVPHQYTPFGRRGTVPAVRALPSGAARREGAATTSSKRAFHRRIGSGTPRGARFGASRARAQAESGRIFPGAAVTPQASSKSNQPCSAPSDERQPCMSRSVQCPLLVKLLVALRDQPTDPGHDLDGPHILRGEEHKLGPELTRLRATTRDVRSPCL